MNTKIQLKSRMGISPILATLLLIVIAVAAIVVTYAWIMTYMSSAGHRAGVMIEIENVYFHDGNVTVTVRNVGTSDTKLASIYMGESASNLLRIWKGSEPLNAKSDVMIEIKLESQVSKKVYYFKAVAEGGQESPLYQAQAP